MSDFLLRTDIELEIAREVQRAVQKFPLWPTDPHHAACVIGEEVGELIQAILQTCYEPDKSDIENVREEAIQAAAMCIRFLQSLESGEYNFVPGHQHTQIK